MKSTVRTLAILFAITVTPALAHHARHARHAAPPDAHEYIAIDPVPRNPAIPAHPPVESDDLRNTATGGPVGGLF